MDTISKRLFSVDSPKAIKSLKFGWLNAIHYMSPASIAGVGNLCPHASEGCKALCLGYHSGQASMVKDAANVSNKNSVRLSRDMKARQFMHNRQAYLEALAKQIGLALVDAFAAQLKLCVRLNGSTDIRWERLRMDSTGKSLVHTYSAVQFTEYTKDYQRMLDWCAGKLPANLWLTFSRSETNEAQCLDVLSKGGNVATVFETLPETWNGYRVIDGDQHDLRHLDPRGVVVGLVPKGAAKKDTSGFVVR